MEERKVRQKKRGRGERGGRREKGRGRRREELPLNRREDLLKACH